MSRVKLTEAQVAVLKRMASGDEVWVTPVPRNSAFWHGKLTDRAPSLASQEKADA